MSGSLDPVWAKIARAKEHADELQIHFQRTYARKSYEPRIGFKADPGAAKGVAYVSKIRDFSEANLRTALIAGDLAHNLRSALDHLVYQLAVKHTNDNIREPNRTQFPICDRRGRPQIGRQGGFGFRGEAQRYLREIDPRYRTRIERLQPYKRRHGDGFVRLRLIRDLDNRDKHRLLLPTVNAPRTYSLRGRLTLLSLLNQPRRRSNVPLMPPVGLRLRANVPLELGTELSRLRLGTTEHRGFDMKMEGSIEPTVTFGERESVLTACNKMVTTVSYIVGIFEDAFK